MVRRKALFNQHSNINTLKTKYKLTCESCGRSKIKVSEASLNIRLYPTKSIKCVNPVPGVRACDRCIRRDQRCEFNVSKQGGRYFETKKLGRIPTGPTIAAEPRQHLSALPYQAQVREQSNTVNEAVDNQDHYQLQQQQIQDQQYMSSVATTPPETNDAVLYTGNLRQWTQAPSMSMQSIQLMPEIPLYNYVPYEDTGTTTIPAPAIYDTTSNIIGQPLPSPPPTAHSYHSSLASTIPGATFYTTETSSGPRGFDNNYELISELEFIVRSPQSQTQEGLSTMLLETTERLRLSITSGVETIDELRLCLASGARDGMFFTSIIANALRMLGALLAWYEGRCRISIPQTPGTISDMAIST